MSQPVSLDARVSISEDIVCRELDGEAVILNLQTGLYFGLDDVGTRIWQLMQECGSLRQVFDSLCEEYDAPSETLQADLLHLVSELDAKGLLVVS